MGGYPKYVLSKYYFINELNQKMDACRCPYMRRNNNAHFL